MAELTCRFFGPPEFTVDGRAVSLGRRKATALAVYLAVTGTPQARAHLADLFWPEYPRDKARASLRRTLSIVTKALGADWLSIDREAVGIRAIRAESGLRVDVAEFLRLADRAEHGGAGAAALEKAAGLYVNGFLAGFELQRAPMFDDWQSARAAELERRAAMVMDLLAESRGRLGRYGPAVQAAQRRVALDPYNEQAHRQLMGLHIRFDRRGAALEQYERCRKLLQQELGLEPDGKTRALARALRSGQQMADVTSRAVRSVSHFPTLSGDFVGRTAELAGLVDRLTDPKVRLVTLTGPGGMGKTRLAAEAADVLAEYFEQGIVFVSLVGASEPEDVCRELADALRLRLAEHPSPAEQLLQFLRCKECLLVLDNLDAPEAGAMPVSYLLGGSERLKVLATSRSRLMLGGEHLFPLGGLDLPETGAEQDRGADPAGPLVPSALEGQYGAVALFVARARMHLPGFAVSADNVRAIVRICALTGGMPLALVLAAGWAELYSLQRMADEIKAGLGVLRSGLVDVEERHKSIHAVFDGSWSHLSGGERNVFRTASIFLDGFSLEALADVVGMDCAACAEVVADLVRKSMIVSGPEQGRFGLHPLLRSYGREQLQGDPVNAERVADAHQEYYLRLAGENGRKLIGEDALVQHQNRQNFKNRGARGNRATMQSDFANIRKAWNRAVARRDIQALADAAQGLYVYFDMHTRYHEGGLLFRPLRELVFEAVRRGLGGAAPAMLLVCWLDMQGQGFPDRDSSLSPDVFAGLHDMGAVLVRRAVETGEVTAKAYAFLLLGAVAFGRGRYRRAARFFRLAPRPGQKAVNANNVRETSGRCSIASTNVWADVPLGALGGVERIFWVSMRLGLCCKELDETEEAVVHFRRGLEIGGLLGDEVKQAWGEYNIGSVRLGQGSTVVAGGHLTRAAEMFHRLDARAGELATRRERALLAFLQGDVGGALSLSRQTLREAEGQGWAEAVFFQARSLAGLCLFVSGTVEAARDHFLAAMRHPASRALGNLGMALFACAEADLLLAEDCRRELERDMALLRKAPLRVLGLLALACVAALCGDDKSARRLLDRMCGHPGLPEGLFALWSLPHELARSVGSRMAGADTGKVRQRPEDGTR